LVAHNSLIGLLAIVLIGCSSASPSPTSVTASEEPTLPATATATAIPEYITKIRNASYELGATDDLETIQLVDGEFQRGAPGDAKYVSVKLTDLIAPGDLDNDGRDEVAGLIAENYGGSGVFTFLALYREVNGSLEFITSVFVDDRPKLDALKIEDREIFLDITTHKADDPFCCPTLHNTRRYRLWVNDQLDLSDYTTFTPDNRPHTITIESPVNSLQVNSFVPIKGSVAIAPFENNLVYRIYDIGGVELAAGAVSVSTNEIGGPGTFDTNILLGNILSGAVVRVEIQDLSAEDGSLIAMDSVELVVK